MDALISIGFCGGLAAVRSSACDIFVATEVVGVAPALAPASSRAFKTGKLLSMDRVVSTAAEKAVLANECRRGGDGSCRSGRAARSAYNVPFYAVRVVTDTCEESFPLDFNRMRSPDGRFSRARILAAALRRPGVVFPELMKLNKRTKRAAQALGDFLADARF